MNINDVVKKAGGYVKLNFNESVLVRFKNEFEESKGEYEGRTFITYNCPCYIRYNDDTETVTKTWSGSARFFDRCLEVARASGLAFDKCNFNITKIENSDKKTDWKIVAMNNVVSDEEPVENVPF